MTIGPMMRELRWLEILSPEKEKMINIQRMTGNQYFKNERTLSTTHQSKLADAEAILILIPFAKVASLLQ